MKTNKLRGRTASIPKTRWAAYAAAGAATALAGCQSAEAEIHYSGHLRVAFRGEACGGSSHRQVHTFQLDQPGDFFRLGRQVSGYCHGYDFCTVAGLVSAAFRGPRSQQSLSNYVSKLNSGQRISSGPFTSFGGCHAGIVAPKYRGYWAAGTGFIGFRFNNGAGIQYGWIRIRMRNFPDNSFRLFDYAYADPGEPLSAGQISSDKGAVEENSLGALALGAVGLLAWRKSRSRSAR